jgi:hypothetical protein
MRFSGSSGPRVPNLLMWLRAFSVLVELQNSRKSHSPVFFADETFFELDDTSDLWPLDLERPIVTRKQSSQGFLHFTRLPQ